MKDRYILSLLCACLMLSIVLSGCGGNLNINDSNNEESSMNNISSTEQKTETSAIEQTSDIDSTTTSSSTATSTTTSKPITTSSKTISTTTFTSKPIIKRTEMMKGEQIPHVDMTISCGNGMNNSVYIILSPEAFGAFKDMIGNNNNYSRYDQDFFHESTIIAMPYPRSSSSYSEQIDSLTKNNNEICIGMTTFHPTANEHGDIPITDDVYPRYIIIEIKKSDIKGITNFSYYEAFKPNPNN